MKKFVLGMLVSGLIVGGTAQYCITTYLELIDFKNERIDYLESRIDKLETINRELKAENDFISK